MFRFLAIFLTICVVIVLAAPLAYRFVNPAQRTERLLEQGREQADEGAWIEARIRFEEVLSKDPENLEARLGLARALREGGLFEASAAHLLRIIGANPDMPGARIEFGEMLFMAGQFAESRKHLEAARTTGEESARLDALEAALALRDGRVEDARELAEAALDADPSLSSAYATLTAIELKSDDRQAGLAMLDRARDAGAEDLSLGLMRLGLYEQLGREDEIGPELDALADRYPQTPDLRLALARWALERNTGDTERAQQIFQDLLQRNAGDQAMLSELAGEMTDLFGADSARGVFERAARAGDLEGAFENQIAVLETAGGDRDGAIARLEREIEAETRAETRNASRLLLARLLDPADDLDRRRALAEEVLETDAQNPSANLLRADVYLRQNDYENAITHLRAALSVRPDAPEILLELARVHVLAGSPELARDRLSKAVQVSGHDPDLALRYAALLERRQGAEAAIGPISIALESHPETLSLLVRRAQLALALGDLKTARIMRDRLSDLEEKPDQVTVALDTAIAAQAGGAERVVETLRGNLEETGSDATRLSLASAYLRADRAAEALDLLDSALEDRPDWREARLLRADARFATQDYEGADADLSAVADDRPDDAETQANLARLRLGMEDTEGADRTIEAGLAASPEDFELQLLQAYRLKSLGRREEALDRFDQLVQQAPEDPRVTSQFGLLLTSDDANAAQIARAERVTAPLNATADPDLKAIRGWILHRGGRNDQAIDLLRDAVSERPEDVRIQAWLGLAEVDGGEIESGQATLSNALDLMALQEDDAKDPALEARAQQTLSALEEGTPSTQSN